MLPLPEVPASAATFAGAEVIAGIRPESLNSRDGAACLSGTVDVVEPTGPDTMVILDVGGQMITARLGARERPTLGQPMTLAVDTAAINLFDPATDNRI
jgi:multiple sugar transport system ATP-binding protein